MRTPLWSALGLLLLTLMPVGVASCGALTKERILYSRAFQLPEEMQGHLRVAEGTVEVNVVGTDAVGKYTIGPSHQIEGVGSHYLVHEEDMLGFIRNNRRLLMSDRTGRLLTEEEVQKILKEKAP